MKIPVVQYCKACVLVLAICFAIESRGVESTSAPTKSQTASDEVALQDGGYFEIGFSVHIDSQKREQLDSAENDDVQVEYGLDISGAYRKNGFFGEAIRSGFAGLNVGYTLANTERYTLDFLAANFSGEITADFDDVEVAASEAERNVNLTERDTLYIGTGLRLSAYHRNYIAQLRVVTDVVDGNGVISTALVGRQWQAGNWTLHGILGARYSSEQANAYRWGITSNEATERFPQYSPSGSIDFNTEFGVTYPINQNWVFRSTFRYRSLSAEVRDSPLVSDSVETDVTSSVNYVF